MKCIRNSNWVFNLPIDTEFLGTSATENMWEQKFIFFSCKLDQIKRLADSVKGVKRNRSRGVLTSQFTM